MLNKKVSYLLGNMGWMTISNFASKILVFMMVPFYTRVLTTGEYGLYDLGYTAVILLAPLLTFNVAESLMRFAIVEPDRVSESFSDALLVTLLGILVAAIVGVCVQFTPLDWQYIQCIAYSSLLFICNLIYLLFSQFARGIDRVKDMAIGGLLNSIFLVSLNYLFVVLFDAGVVGCYLATSLSMLIAAVFIASKIRFWKYLSRPSLTHLKKMAAYGFPLGINTLGWWVNNAMGRYGVAFVYGASSAGLLAAAYKIPSIPKVMQQIFVQAWQISSIKEFDPEDSDGFFSKTYNMMCVLSSMLTSVVIIAMPLLAKIMFANEFYEAWTLVPLLMIGVVFNCLASVVGGVFMAIGDSKPIATSAAVSVVAALGACIVFIPLVGVQGAAISSAISSVVIWAFRMHAARPLIDLHIDWFSSVSCFVVLGLQIVLSLTVSLGFIWVLVQLACLLAFAVLLLRQIDVFGIVEKLIQRVCR